MSASYLLDVISLAYFVRKLLEGEEDRLNVVGPGSFNVYSHAMYAPPAYGRMAFSLQSQLSSAASYPMSSRFYTSSLSADETISASQAQQAEASPPHEEEEEEVEQVVEKKKEEDAEEGQEEEGEDEKEEEAEVEEEEKQGEGVEEADGEG